MGQGIAITCAAAGLDVLLCEASADRAREATTEIAASLDRDIAKWRRTEADKRAILARLRSVPAVADLAAAELVIESVPEDLALKARIFQELDRACR